MSNPVILIIDDDKAILDLLEDQIHHWGGDRFDVEAAMSGEEALALVKELDEKLIPIAVVICDHQLPDVAGDDLLLQLEPICPDAYKIFLTGNQSSETFAAAVNKIKLYRYLTKPWNEEDLLRVVETAVKSYLQKRETEELVRMVRSFVRSMQEVHGDSDPVRIVNRHIQNIAEQMRAEKVYYLTTEKGRLNVSMAASYSPDETRRLQAALQTDHETVNKTVLLHVTDALNADDFPSHRLVLPVQKHGADISYLFLENPGSRRKFSHNQYELLQLFAAQLGVSLENARLFERLQKRTRELEANRERIEENQMMMELAQKELNDYRATASNIQRVYLPPAQALKAIFPESLIFHRPADDVAGDLYWFSERFYKCMFAVASSNLKSIDAGFWSVSSLTLLNQIVHEYAISDPDVALDYFNRRLTEALSPQRAFSRPVEMRMSYCIVDQADDVLHFAGVGLPMLHFRGAKATYVPGQPGSIGRIAADGTIPFLELPVHTQLLEEGDTVYLYTESAVAAFIGPPEIPKRVERFHDLLNRLRPMPMDEQYEELGKLFKPSKPMDCLILAWKYSRD
ncbi:MAG: response regulator [Bacteroidia bacterium]|nr:response regulator [Bacteroidia bacterium]